jgi:DtxR family transcriptional regulator, Mn-dependent transcriptional regulator
MNQNSFHESHEDYLKAIYKISKTHRGGWVSNSEISRFLGVKPSSVTSMLYNLREGELIDWKPRGSVRLTSKGKKIAQHTLKNYQILYDFFFHFLKLKNKELVRDISCKIEHHLPEEVSAALQGLLID